MFQLELNSNSNKNNSNNKYKVITIQNTAVYAQRSERDHL